MKIILNLPEYAIPTQEDTKTRSMDNKAESTITASKLNVFVFKDYKGTQKFYYKAPIVSVEQNTTDPSKSTVTVKLVKSTIQGEKTNFDFLFVANSELPASLNLTEGVTTKDEVIEAVKFDMPKENNEYDKWNATTGSSTPFPMWGEQTNVEIKESGNDLTINMFRALARIDVGLAFKMEGNKLTEEAEGFEGHKIKEVKVYRTYNSGYVIPQEQNKPHISTEFERRADNKPLEFTLSTPSDSYTREIYVPEADLPPNNPNNNNMHCLVIGVEHNNKTSYYRLDFAIDPNLDTRKYEAILRNYRYVFNILNIKGPGFEDAPTALKSTPSGNIDYEMIKWDETIHEMHVQGKYHFGLDNREFTFEPKSSIKEPTNVHLIKYQTNYPISDSDGLTFEWEKGGLFEAEWITKGSNGEIKLTALTTNETNKELTDILSVKLGSFMIKTTINQEYVNFEYTINCSTVMVYGTYKPDHELNNTHYIELEFTADDESIFGSPYELFTEPIYGITFKASGVFSQLKNKIRLQGEGTLQTPDDARTEPFSVIIRSNSSSDSYCEATINPVLAKVNILSIAWDLDPYGYNIAFSNSAGNKVLSSPNNFGPNDNSRVKIEGFNFIGSQDRSGFTNNAEIRKWLTGIGNGGQIADIVHIAWNIAPNASDNNMLAEYMEKGGVLIAYLQTETNTKATTKYLMERIYGTTVTMSDRKGTAVFAMPGHQVYRENYTTEEDWYTHQEKLLSDPILNGPFGDLRDKQWGEDVLLTLALHSLNIKNDEHTMIYSYATDISEIQPDYNDKRITALKYESEKYNIVWFGDGGFSSYNGGSSTTICPFWYDKATFFPLPKPVKYGGCCPVYNAPIFCNTIAWAIERANSPELRAKKEALLGK